MEVSFIMEQARSGELRSLSAVDKTDSVVLSYINLGLIELYKRFNVLTKVEVITTSPVTPIYTLRSTDINQVLSVYDQYNKELIAKQALDDEDYDITQINFNTFMLTEPMDEELLFVYKAAPAKVTSVNDVTELPPAMLEALLHYIGYRAHGSVNGNVDKENNTHYMRFEKSCTLLKDEGYLIDTSNITKSVQAKGYA